MVPQITKTGKPGKSLIEVFFPAFPQDKCLCVVNYLKSYERKTTKYRNVTKETQALLFISFIRPDAPVSSAVITRWLKAVLARAGMDTASFQGHSVRSAASSSTKKLGVSSAEIMKVADWSRESTFIKFYPKTPLNVLLLEGRFYHQPNPVLRTEYKSKYKGHDPKLVQGSTSPILKPRNKNEPEPAAHPTERTRPEAGLLSTEVHVTKEPPLQHKRIVPYERNHNILTTETTKQFLENGDDTDKKKNPILAYDAKLQKLKKDKQDKVKQRVKMKSKRSPKRKIVIDESKTAGKPSELVRYVALEPPLQRKRISPYRGNHNILRTHTVNYVDVSETTTERSDEISSGAASSNGSIDRARRKLAFEDDDASDGGLKQKDSGLGKTHVTQPQKDHDVDMGDDEVRKEKPRAGFVEKPAAKPPPSPQKLQRKNDLKEIERKQGDRVNRSLQIKAGMRTIEPPLYSHPVKSEYQRQFEWKEGYKFDAPVLSAEQMVFRSDPNVIPRPSVVKTFPKKTEYRSQFVEYPMVDVKSESSEDKENDDKNVDNFETSKVSNGEKEEEKSKLKEPKPKKPKGQRKARKTKFKGLSPDKMPPAGQPSITTAEDKRLVLPSRNVQPFFFPHGERRKFLTEYKANYRSPKKYTVSNGAWQGADPPQLQPDKWETESNHSDWFKEVVKLRQKADQFKSRERETHFTSAHLAWLEEEQSDLLERTSKESSLSSQSEPNEIEEVKSDSEPSSLLPGDAGNRIPVPPSLPNEAEHEEDMEDDGNQSEGESRDSHEVVASSQNGRLPTPRLTKASEHRRHHLDRTTPHTGGAILTSPQKKRNDKQNQSSQTSKKVPVSKTDRPQLVWAWDEKSPQSAFTSPSIKRKKDKKSPRQDAGSTHVAKEGSGEGGRKHRTVYDSKNYQGELSTAGNKNKPDKEFTQHKNQEHDRSFRQSLRESSDTGHMKSKYIYDSENYKGDHEDPGITSETNSLEDILHPDYKTKKIETSKFTKPPRAFSVPVDDGTVTLESDVGSLEDVVRPDATAFSKTKRTSVLTQEKARRKDRYLTSTTDFSSVIEDSSASDADPVGKTRTIRHYMPPRSFVVPTERKYGKGLNRKQDEDIDELLSESSMSARSFLASETLERAKTRKDNFWK